MEAYRQVPAQNHQIKLHNLVRPKARRRRSAPSSIPGNLEDDIPVATTTTSPPVVQPPVPPLQAVNAYNLARYDEKENFSPSGTQASAIICLNLGSTHITPKPILRPPPPAHIYKKPHTPAETLAELLSSHSNSASIATESSSAEEEDCQNPAAQDPVPKPLAERATPTNRPDPLSTVKTSASEAKSKAQPLLPIALIPAQQPITPSSREITPVTPKSNPHTRLSNGPNTFGPSSMRVTALAVQIFIRLPVQTRQPQTQMRRQKTEKLVLAPYHDIGMHIFLPPHRPGFGNRTWQRRKNGLRIISKL
ncbi:hypothetical protein DFS34DRAFT_263977 [Phlyctochytrium arcticum]|nr:hypothetical protein DFS34DRAFT_263977 [Phlyctochytrium arcticum]